MLLQLLGQVYLFVVMQGVNGPWDVLCLSPAMAGWLARSFTEWVVWVSNLPPSLFLSLPWVFHGCAWLVRTSLLAGLKPVLPDAQPEPGGALSHQHPAFAVEAPPCDSSRPFLGIRAHSNWRMSSSELKPFPQRDLFACFTRLHSSQKGREIFLPLICSAQKDLGCMCFVCEIKGLEP